MNGMHDQLLRELGISKSQENYEIYKQLKEKRTEYMFRIGSQNSLQENQRLQILLEKIGKAECYFEDLSKEEKKENKWDGFDYSSLKGKKKKKRRVYVPERSEDEHTSVMTFEERYENIIGFMGTPDGFEAGLEQLKQLGEEGCLTAQKHLARLFYCGEKSVAADKKESFYWYEKAAGQSDTESQSKIGYMCMRGIGVEANREGAIKWLEMAVKSGDEKALLNLELVCCKMFEPKDYQKAVYWYEFAANQFSSPIAYHRLGLIYLKDSEVGPDWEKAVYWFKKASEKDYPYASWNLGVVYGELMEPRNYEKAVEWYEISAKKFSNANACDKLGLIYMNDNGVGPNREQAIYWFEKAYHMGNRDAAWNLGQVYGDVFEPKDYRNAVYWYEVAADEFANEDACNKLGFIYMNHNEVGPNQEKAIYWLERAYYRGNENAAYNLGWVYGNCFAEKNYNKALYWYERAAVEQEDENAMFLLGTIYEDIQRNFELAAKWYLKAIQYGNSFAQYRFDKLAGKVQR